MMYHLDKEAPSKSSLAQHPAVAVTRGLVQARTRELALLSGRTAHDVSQVDYEQAKRELTGEADMDRQDAILDALPEPAAIRGRS